MDKNKAIVYVAGFFAWGMVSIIRVVYTDGQIRPAINMDLTRLKDKKEA